MTALQDAKDRLTEALNDLADALDADDAEILSRQVARAEENVEWLSE